MKREVRRKALLLMVGSLLLLQSKAVIVYAQEADLSPTPAPIDYQLPYPGLLPDHPLYFLKQAREALWGFFASGALPKAEYNLDQADKHIQATLMLVDQKKPDLAQESLSEAISYFDDAIEKTIAAKQQGTDTSEFVKKLLLANRKHQEVVATLAKKNPKQFKELSKKVGKLEKRVKALQPKK